MLLKKFRINKKIKRIYIALGITLFLLGGSILIYRSYANYQEIKSYNVIEGIIPDFGYDIKLAYTIDGKDDNKNTFPNKESNYVGKSVECKNGVKAEWDNINWGLKNITNTNNSETIRCTIDFKAKETFSEKVKPGDYIKMTPLTETFTISKELTGYTVDQTINPQELSLWRVLQINSDGTIDMISEYTSSNKIRLEGEAGYKNYIGTLNMIAGAYENSEFTVGSRYPGYNGQTKFIKNDLTKETSGTINTRATGWDPKTEPYGGGDVDFNKNNRDLNLIHDIYGTYLTTNGSGTNNYYWIAKRWYQYNSESSQRWYVVYISKVEYIDNFRLWTTTEEEYGTSAGVRPIVTLKSGLEAISGDGKKDTPWTFETDTGE